MLELGLPATVVTPLPGRLVVFRSELVHEVLPSQAERHAVTVWFSRAAPAAAAAAATAQVAAAVSGPPQAAPPPPPPPAAAARQPAQPTIMAGRQAEAVTEQLRADTLHGQLRQVILDSSEANGPCKARALAQRLWDEEEFVLQIDSHMRFVPGWDASLLCQLRQAGAAAGHDRLVLSSYPPGYESQGPGAVLLPDSLPAVLCASHFGPDGLLRLGARKLRARPDAPLPSFFWAAGFSFSQAGVPPVLHAAPYLTGLSWLFFSEELLQLLSLQRAWSVCAPSEVVAFHGRWPPVEPRLPARFPGAEETGAAGRGGTVAAGCAAAAGGAGRGRAGARVWPGLCQAHHQCGGLGRGPAGGHAATLPLTLLTLLHVHLPPRSPRRTS